MEIEYLRTKKNSDNNSVGRIQTTGAFNNGINDEMPKYVDILADCHDADKTTTCKQKIKKGFLVLLCSIR